MAAGITLPELAQRVERYFGLTHGEIRKRQCKEVVITAEEVICNVAVRVLRQSGVAVGAILGINKSAVSQAARRGQVEGDRKQGKAEEILRLVY